MLEGFSIAHEIFDQAPLGISNLACCSAARFPVKIATADLIAFSGPQRIGLPVLTAAQNSATSFL